MEQGWPGLAQYIPAVPADWSPRPRTVQDALDQLAARGGGAGFAASFVWRPGGVASPGVYVTWAALVAAFAGIDPAAQKIVAVDDSIAAAHITTGAWANCDNIEFVSGGADSGPGADVALVIIDQGASLSGVVGHLSFSNCNGRYDATSGAFITTAANQNFLLDLNGCSLAGDNLGGTGLVSAGAGATIAVKSKISFMQGQLFAGTATSVFFGVFVDLSIIGPGVVNMTAGATVALQADGSAVISATQTPAPTIAIADPTPTFVFRPGGTAGGNVYTDWATMMAAVAQCPGPRFVSVDATLATANTSAGTWDIDEVYFCSHKGTTGANTTLHIVEGTVFKCSRFTLDDGLAIICDATATVPLVSSAGVNPAVRIFVPNGGILESSAGIPFFQLSAGGSMNFNGANISVLGDGTHAWLTIDAGQTSTINVYNGTTVQANGIAGAGTAVINYDGSVSLSATQSVTTLTLNFKDTTNFQQAVGNTGSGGATVTATTANIAKKRTGKVDVIGTVSGVASGAANLTVSVQRDGVDILALSPIALPATALAFAVTVPFIDTLPDSANHTYTVRANVSAGTITSGASGLAIRANEL